MIKRYFPHIVKKGETLGKIIDKSGKEISKKGLVYNIYPGQEIDYKKGKLTVNKKSAYKNIHLRTHFNLKSLSSEFTIKKGDWISKVIGKANSIKFKSVLNKFPIQFIGDKIKINGNSISLIRNGKIINTLNISGEAPSEINKLSDDHLKDIEKINEVTVFEDLKRTVSSGIRREKNIINKRTSYSKKHLKALKGYQNLLKKIKNKDHNTLYGLYGKIQKFSKNIEGTFLAKGLYNRTDGNKKLEFKLKYKPKTVVIKKVNGIYRLALYGSDGILKIASYASPGVEKPHNGKKITSTNIKVNRLQPWNNKGKKWLTDKFHLSSGTKYEGAIMTYAVHVNGPISIHFGKVTGIGESHGCIRLPLFYAKGFFDEIKKIGINNINIEGDLNR